MSIVVETCSRVVHCPSHASGTSMNGSIASDGDSVHGVMYFLLLFVRDDVIRLVPLGLSLSADQNNSSGRDRGPSNIDILCKGSGAW